jgi:sugar O-acyltransferase (sialic acid O-acetyltransferase NeuD family)
MNRLLIIGAGDFGRELESWLGKIPSTERNWEIGGYLDANPSALDDYPSDYKILGDPLTFDYKAKDRVLLAISNPNIKESVYERIQGKVELFSFVDPTAVLGKFNNIGTGVVICPNVIVSTNVTIGKCVTINNATQIGHDSIIGDFTSFMANITVGGHCTIGRNTFIGSGVTIIPNRKIGSVSKIGAGSVVIAHVGDNKSVFGNPARKI